jgi:hypothetical protein
MNTPEILFETLIEQGQSFSTLSIKLAKLKALEKATQLAATLLSGIAVIILFSVFLIVLTIGAALWLGDIIGHTYYGFFVVAFVYLFLGTASHFLLYGWIKKPISNLLISQVLNTQE